MRLREGEVSGWVEHFAAATASAAQLATSYLHAVRALASRWRERLSSLARPPRSDAAAWAIIDLLPAHPLITAPVAAAVTGWSKPAIYQALEELESVGVLVPLTQSQRTGYGKQRVCSIYSRGSRPGVSRRRAEAVSLTGTLR
ncbi:MAG TPA: hypothetical protein VF006_24490 [Longimicrobium sp.]